jgi:hypothetical protein
MKVLILGCCLLLECYGFQLGVGHSLGHKTVQGLHSLQQSRRSLVSVSASNAATSVRCRSSALARCPLYGVRGGSRDDSLSNSSSTSLDGSSDSGSDSSAASDDDDDDNTKRSLGQQLTDDDDDAVVVQAEVVFEDLPRAKDVWNPTTEDNEKQAMLAKHAESREMQSGAYKRSSFLLLALAIDIVMTKAKRMELWGIAAATSRLDLRVLGVTAMLSSSFLLGSAVLYLLSTMISHDNSTMYVSYAKQWNVFVMAFSSINIITYCTMGKPFMGLAATGIHIHNLMVTLNGWMKGVKGITNDDDEDDANNKSLSVGILLHELQQGLKNTVVHLIPDMNKSSIFSIGFAAAAAVSAVQSGMTLKGIMSLAKVSENSEKCIKLSFEM